MDITFGVGILFEGGKIVCFSRSCFFWMYVSLILAILLIFGLIYVVLELSISSNISSKSILNTFSLVKLITHKASIHNFLNTISRQLYHFILIKISFYLSLVSFTWRESSLHGKIRRQVIFGKYKIWEVELYTLLKARI